MTLTVSVSLLAPAAALALWSIIVMFWMAAKRFPALKVAKIPKEIIVGGRGQDLDKILPPRTNWPAHNYAHLMEQPTIFYPVIVILAVLGQGTALNIALAWAYVGLRIIHSVWQIQVNTIPLRATIFFVSSLVLMVLTINALVAALH
ncbi:MAG: MAPEG family protein [Sphingobium sp.]